MGRQKSTFFSGLDVHSANLMNAYAKEGGIEGRKIKTMTSSTNDTIEVRRECIFKSLCMYLNEDPEKLEMEYLYIDGVQMAIAETVFGNFVIQAEDAEPGNDAMDVVIALEGMEVMSNLGNVSFALVMLLVRVYVLNLSCPQELKYTFEVLQKIILELDGNKLSNKAQVLKTWLSH